MFYLIIPPLVIIIGSAVLVSFLLRKASRIPVQPIAGEEKKEKRLKGIGKLVLAKAVQIILRLLEKITKHFRLSSLKFHNLSQRWFQSIRKKREKIKSEKTPAVEVEKEIKRTEESEGKKPLTFEIPEKTAAGRPMISREVVHPEIKNESRNRLEEALVERIAANPADIEAYERLGDYYAEKGSYDDALECFKQVLKLSPVHHKAKIRIARLEKMLGR